MNTPSKKRAPVPEYVSPNQLTLDGFETPFERKLNPGNRWVVLAHLIPWDEICGLYLKLVPASKTGRPALSPRLILGSLIIKHMCNLDDRETVDLISENIYMQYFLGYTSFTDEKPFDASLFVDFRKRLGVANVNAINERIVALKTHFESDSLQQKALKPSVVSQDEHEHDNDNTDGNSSTPPEELPHKGRVIFDATACPQDIAYPTDLSVMNDAREKVEEMVAAIYDFKLHGDRPRLYQQKARKDYLKTAQKKNKSKKEIRNANKKQLNYLKRGIKVLNRLLDVYEQEKLAFPLDRYQQKYLWVIQLLYAQQKEMYCFKTHSIENRIVSIHQPHVRPIVRGKQQAKVEFGAKIHVSVIDGISFLDELSWEAYNEGAHMMNYIELYRKRFGFYPREVLADKIYCNRANRAALKALGIRLIAKPLGRPSALSIHVSPGERNPIEGKFGQAKTGYGLNRIKARLQGTSESWIATIILVLNLVKLAGVALLRPYLNMVESFSAWVESAMIKSIVEFQHLKSFIRIDSSMRNINVKQVA